MPRSCSCCTGFPMASAAPGSSSVCGRSGAARSVSGPRSTGCAGPSTESTVCTSMPVPIGCAAGSAPISNAPARRWRREMWTPRWGSTAGPCCRTRMLPESARSERRSMPTCVRPCSRTEPGSSCGAMPICRTSATSSKSSGPCCAWPLPRPSSAMPPWCAWRPSAAEGRRRRSRRIVMQPTCNVALGSVVPTRRSSGESRRIKGVAMTVYAQPGQDGSLVTFKSRYENFIGGRWVPPVGANYFENPSPVTGQVFTEVPASTSEDIELAVDAGHKAAPAWGKTSVAERANILNRIADRMEDSLELLAVAETWDNGKAVRECLNADLPLAVDHFRYFAGAIRAQEGGLSQIDDDTVAYHFHEPLGVVGQIIPWNFPILMGVWKLAPALAAGNCVVLKPAEQTPASILVLVELIADLLPEGVLNVVNGFGLE